VHVPSNQQGELQGALTGLMSVTTIFGPLIMNHTFAYFTSQKAPVHFPGIHFLIGAACMLMSIIIIWQVLQREKRKKLVREAAMVEAKQVEEVKS